MSENQHLDADFVDEWAACPKCGENDTENLITNDGLVHCATCGHDYDLEPERAEASNA
jgi:Zn ribbon nucleic-acid-binding protein